MNPQEFLSNRVSDIKDMLTGQASADTYINQAKLLAPGGIPGKAAVHGAHQIINSAGTRGASKMSLLGLGGNAPVYGTPFNDNSRGSYEARVQ
jgi:hypothetical protein